MGISNAESAKLKNETKISFKPEVNVCIENYRIYKHRDMCSSIPNPKFVFHNKLPKSGSTTFLALLNELRKRNNFDLAHLIPCFDQNDPKLVQEDSYFRKHRPDWDPTKCKHTLKRNADLVHWLGQVQSKKN